MYTLFFLGGTLTRNVCFVRDYFVKKVSNGPHVSYFRHQRVFNHLAKRAVTTYLPVLCNKKKIIEIEPKDQDTSTKDHILFVNVFALMCL